MVTTTSNGARVVNTKLLLENEYVRKLYQDMERVFRNGVRDRWTELLDQILAQMQQQKDDLQKHFGAAQEQAELFERARGDVASAELDRLRAQFEEFLRKYTEILEQSRQAVPKHDTR